MSSEMQEIPEISVEQKTSEVLAFFRKHPFATKISSVIAALGLAAASLSLNPTTSDASQANQNRNTEEINPRLTPTRDSLRIRQTTIRQSSLQVSNAGGQEVLVGVEDRPGFSNGVVRAVATGLNEVNLQEDPSSRKVYMIAGNRGILENIGQVYRDTFAVAIDQQDGNRIVGLRPHGFEVTTDGGRTWKHEMFLQSLNMHGLTLSPDGSKALLLQPLGRNHL
jgi:hypothetical protein